jgi:RND family efflux transporter MFP subunit
MNRTQLIVCVWLPALLMTAGCTRKATTPAGEPGIHVKTITVTTSAGNAALSYSGTIEAARTIPLTFRVSGTIDQIFAEEGDAVRKGQLLATLDKSDLQQVYTVARSKYDQAKDAYDRLKSVHNEGSLTEIKWVEMETTLEQAKASADLAKNNLEKCELRATADGVLARRNAESGQSALGASFEIADIRNVYAKISVPEKEIGTVKKGMKASITVSALNDNTFEGSVSRLNPVADMLSRTYEAMILLPNPQAGLKPGMICDVTLSLGKRAEQVVIPYQSVTQDKDGSAYVFVVDSTGTHARKQVITPGNYADGGVVVLQGLQPGQVLVVEGKEKLSDHCLIVQ